MINKTRKQLNIPTPHNCAKANDIAKRVIMPGDPKRATWIAENFLKNTKLVTNVRGILGYTGKYKNCPVTVMAHGMGIPSICIYSHELYNFYNVDIIYRIGSCGVYSNSKCNVGDVIVPNYAWADINVSNWMNVKEDKKNIFYPTKQSFNLIIKTANEKKIPFHILPAISSNFFYHSLDKKHIIRKTKCYVVEMEGYGLFMEAKLAKKRAACLLTISDNIDTHEMLTSDERVVTFKNMVKLALDSIIKEKI